MIKIILDRDLKQGEYEGTILVGSRIGIINEPEVPNNPGPLNPVLLKVPKIEKITHLIDCSSINKNTALPYYDPVLDDNFLLSHDESINKVRCFKLNVNNFDIKLLGNLDIIYNDREIRGMLQSVCVYQNEVYGLFDKEDVLYLIKKRNNSWKQWDVVRDIPFEGANDTHHDLFINKDGNLQVRGRIRGVERPETDYLLKNRRGIRQFLLGDYFSITKTLKEIDPLRVIENWLYNKIREHFYGSRTIMIDGYELMFINVFHTNENRVPPKRPERIDGTGPLYPRLYVQKINRLFEDSPVPLKQFMRNWPLPQNQPYNPEVGQLYISGLLDTGNKILVTLINRVDTHYEEMAGQQPTKIYIGELNREEVIKFLKQANNG